MSDLNNWRLVAPGINLSFGTASTEFPFSGQFSMSAVKRDVQDASHPGDDGLIMGRDRLRGFNLQFDCRILAEYPVTEKPWLRAMDLYSAFAAQWRVDNVRLDPGQYATLVNDDRERMVYGRPRDIAPKNDNLRRGSLDFQMDFATNGPDWYDFSEKVAVFGNEPASSGRLFAPLKTPLITIAPATDSTSLANEGDLPASPLIEFYGPTPACALEMFQGSKLLWTIRVPNRLAEGEVLVVDTRFWRRSAVLNRRQPANGMIRGDSLSRCRIPLGQFSARFTHQDQTGKASAVIRWRDTFAGP